MNPFHAFIVFASLVAILSTGCNTLHSGDSAAEYNADPLTVAVPAEATPEQVQNAMTRALEARDWIVTAASPNEVLGELQHRGFDAKVRLVREGDLIKIYSDSRYLSPHTDQYEPAVPYGWLENIQKDTRAFLRRAS